MKKQVPTKKKREVKIDIKKSKILERYMIQAAKQKRCVTYSEIENILCISSEDIGAYAGNLGDNCLKKKLPLLNGLIISATKCCPSEGFDQYLEKSKKKNWGEVVTDCWKNKWQKL